MRVASVDVGSNSVKMHVAEVGDGLVWEPLVDRTEITRLSEGLQETGALAPQAMERTLEALEKFMEEARQLGVREVVAVGTMCLREASNAAQFLALARDRLGVEIQVIDGAEEARLSYLAILSGLPLAEGVVAFDTGGGSTEFTVGRGACVESRFSLNLGAVRLTREFLRSDPPTEGEVAALLAHLEHALRELRPPSHRFQVVGMGGTVTTMAAVKLGLSVYDPEKVHGTLLSRHDVQEQVRLYATTPLAQRVHIVGLHPKRADIILAGACVVLQILGALGVDSLLVSDRGLRHGLLFDRFIAGSRGLGEP